MLGRERLPVDLVGEQRLVAQRLLDGQAPLEGELALLALDAAVEAAEDRPHGAVAHPGLLEQGAKRRAAPAGGADGLVEPRLAERARRQARAPVAGALHGHRELDRRAGADLVEGERELARDEAADAQPPARRVDVGDVVVGEQVVHPDRRHGMAKRLERHPVVSRGELQLEAATILQPIYERAGEWERLVESYHVLAGSAEDPLFIITGLTAGQVYQVYVSAANEGAESPLSEPVNGTPLLAAAA